MEGQNKNQRGGAPCLHSPPPPPTPFARPAPLPQITMGTFIVSFIGNGFVSSAENLPQLRNLTAQRRRRVLVTVYYTFIVSLFILFGVLIIPDVVREGADFVSRLQTENLWVVVLEKMRKGLG